MSAVWKRNVFYVCMIALSIYATTAYVAAVAMDNAKASCERGNVTRASVFEGIEARIVFNRTVYVAVREGPNAERVRGAMVADIKMARRSLEALTLSPGTAHPWAVDCETAHPTPLPWP